MLLPCSCRNCPKGEDDKSVLGCRSKMRPIWNGGGRSRWSGQRLCDRPGRAATKKDWLTTTECQKRKRKASDEEE